jgi:hypothetical protein
MRHGLHVFEVSKLKYEMRAAGFTDFQAELSGSILSFSTRKQA